MISAIAVSAPAFLVLLFGTKNASGQLDIGSALGPLEMGGSLCNTTTFFSVRYDPYQASQRFQNCSPRRVLTLSGRLRYKHINDKIVYTTIVTARHHELNRVAPLPYDSPHFYTGANLHRPSITQGPLLHPSRANGISPFLNS